MRRCYSKEMATAIIKKKKAVEPRRTMSSSAKVEQFTPEIRLSKRDSQIVLAALQSPPKPNAKMKRAAARFNQFMAKKS